MARRKIALLGQPLITEEGTASEAITPGHLVQGVTSISKRSTAAIATSKSFALERDEMGDDIDTAYASGDTVKVGHFHSGQRVYAFIASGQNITADQKLEPAADGTLRAIAAGVAIARALEAVNNSAGPSTARIRVEVL
jgi:hypothetical protein